MENQRSENARDQAMVDKSDDQSGQAKEDTKHKESAELSVRSNQGSGTGANVGGSREKEKQAKPTNNLPKEEGLEDTARQPSEGRLSDERSEAPLTLWRYLREGARANPNERNDRERFGRGRHGMRRYLKDWQHNWNSITKRKGT